jgi:hypothetical protein
VFLEKGVRKDIVGLLIATGLCACSSVPEAYFATDIQAITEHRLPNFRQARNETVSFRAAPGFKPVSVCGCVFAQYQTDSTGIVFNPEIIESEPSGVYNRTARKYLRLVRYIHAEINPGLIPVETIQKNSFT